MVNCNILLKAIIQNDSEILSEVFDSTKLQLYIEMVDIIVVD